MSKENPVSEEALTPQTGEQSIPLSVAPTQDNNESTSAPGTPEAADPNPKGSLSGGVTAPAVTAEVVSGHPLTDQPEKGHSETSHSKATSDANPAPDTEDSEPRWEADPVGERGSAVQTGTAAQETQGSATIGIMARCFDGCASVGPLLLLVLWAVQSLPSLIGKELHALYDLAVGAQSCLFAGAHVAAQATQGAQAELPLFGWFLSGLSHIPGLDAAILLLSGIFSTGTASSADPLGALVPVAAALATLFLVLLTWALAKAVGNDNKTALAAGLVLLTSLTFMGIPAFAGDALLFAAVLTLASLCLYRGWIKTFAPLWLTCGFVFVALATLSGGLVGLVLPLLVSLLFLVWRLTFRRAGARDGALPFGLMLILLCVWATSVAFSDGGKEQLATLLDSTVIDPVRMAWNGQGRDLPFAFLTLALLWLPWVLLIPFLPWERLGTFFGNIVRNRTQRPGQGWIWCSLLGGMVVLGLLGGGEPLFLLPLLPPLAVLTAQGLLSLSARRSRGFYLFLSLLLLFVAVLFVIADVYPLISDAVPATLAAMNPAPLPLAALLLQVGIFVVFGLLLWKGVNRASASGSLLAVTVLAVILAAPLGWFTSSASVPALPATQESTPPEGTPAVSAPEQAPVQTPEQTTEPGETPAVPATPVDTPTEAPAVSDVPATSEPSPASTPEPEKTVESQPAAEPLAAPTADAPSENAPVPSADAPVPAPVEAPTDAAPAPANTPAGNQL